MLKLSKNKISLFLIIIAMFLLIVSFGNCEAKYEFDIVCIDPLWDSPGIVLQTFAESVRFATQGDINIKIFPGGEWSGGEEDYCQSLQLGTLDMALTMAGVIGQYTEAVALFDTPFLFKSTAKEVSLMFDSSTKHSSLVEEVLDKASGDAKFNVLALKTGGKRDIFASKPIRNYEDVQGIKIRTMATSIQVDAFKFAGMQATPLPYSECFTALQLKTVDAMENTPNSYQAKKFNEVAPYYLVTDHLAGVMAISISKKAWDSLPNAYQNIIKKCAVGACYVSTMYSLGSYDYNLNNTLPDITKEINYMEPSEKQKLRETVLPKLLDKYSKRIGIDIIRLLAEDDELIASWLEKNQ